MLQLQVFLMIILGKFMKITKTCSFSSFVKPFRRLGLVD